MNLIYTLLYVALVAAHLLSLSGCVVVKVPPSSEVRDVNVEIGIYKAAVGEGNSVHATTEAETEAGYNK